MPTSTSMSISQFPALRVSGLQGLRVGSGQGDRISGVLDQHPYLAVAVVVGVAVGDARSSGTSARSVACQQRAVMRSESGYVHDPLNSLSAQRGSASPPANSVDLKWNNTGGRGRYRTADRWRVNPSTAVDLDPGSQFQCPRSFVRRRIR
jgi:hypothetical protein